MLQWKNNRSAFTLIELLVVVIIVAVLASVAIPLLSANVIRAKASEAESGLGTIRTALRAYFAENQTYTDADLTNIGLDYETGAGNLSDDLDGRYFSDDAYDLTIDESGLGYCITVDGALSLAFKNDDVNGSTDGAGVTTGSVQRAMDENGTIFRDTTSCG
jgi:prepilin-type N-terminal cleavage/methylation domain-containing protein